MYMGNPSLYDSPTMLLVFVHYSQYIVFFTCISFYFSVAFIYAYFTGLLPELGVLMTVCQLDLQFLAL